MPLPLHSLRPRDSMLAMSDTLSPSELLVSATDVVDDIPIHGRVTPRAVHGRIPLVFVHGLGMSTDYLEPTMNFLAADLALPNPKGGAMALKATGGAPLLTRLAQGPLDEATGEVGDPLHVPQ